MIHMKLSKFLPDNLPGLTIPEPFTLGNFCSRFPELCPDFPKPWPWPQPMPLPEPTPWLLEKIESLAVLASMIT